MKPRRIAANIVKLPRCSDLPNGKGAERDAPGGYVGPSGTENA
jgi:hypothetical protein